MGSWEAQRKDLGVYPVGPLYLGLGISDGRSSWDEFLTAEALGMLAAQLSGARDWEEVIHTGKGDCARAALLALGRELPGVE